MSRHCHCNQTLAMPHMQGCGFGGGYGTGCCNFSSLIILILILLFFGAGLGGRRRGPCEGGAGYEEGFGLFGGNAIFGGIIFIITLFYLSCCGPGKCGFR